MLFATDPPNTSSLVKFSSLANHTV